MTEPQNMFVRAKELSFADKLRVISDAMREGAKLDALYVESFNHDSGNTTARVSWMPERSLTNDECIKIYDHYTTEKVTMWSCGIDAAIEHLMDLELENNRNSK